MNLKKIGAFALGPIGAAFLGLITVPVLAWTFSMEDIGRLNVLNVAVSFALLVSVLGLDQAYVRDYYETDNKSMLLKTCFVPGFLFLLLGTVVTAPFSKDIALFMYGEAKSEFFWITLYCVIAAFVSRFLSLILRMQERGLAYSMSQLIPKLVMLLAVCSIAFAGMSREFLNLQLAFLISTSTVLVTYVWNTRSEWLSAVESKTDSASTTSLLRFGVPLVFSGVIYWGLIATSTLTLRIYAPLSELGLYSITASFAAVAGVFQSIFTVIWAPTVYRWQAENVDMARVYSVSNQVLMAMCVVCALCGMLSWITDYLLPAEYSSVKYLLLGSLIPPLMYTLSEVTSIGIGITKRTHLTIWVTLTAFITNVVISTLLVPLFGAAGAIISNAIAYVIFFIMRTEFSFSVWRVFPRFRMYSFVLLLLGSSLLTIFLGDYYTYGYLGVWFIVLFATLVCFKSDIRYLWHEIKPKIR